MVQPLEALKSARDLLSDPKHWTQDWYAKNAAGRGVDPAGAQATCWCVRGAVVRFTRCHLAAKPAFVELAATLGSQDYHDVECWNDNPERTHAEVLGLFDTTIARLESEKP